MCLFGVGQRLRCRAQRGRLEDGEHLLEHAVLQPPTAQALAAFLSAIELLGAGAQVTRAVAVGPRVAGLHQPTAFAAAQPALQQRRAFTRRAATEAAWGAPVLAQPGGVDLEGGPVDEPGMVVGDQHRPLITRQQHGALHELARRVDTFLGAGAAEHERPCIDRVGEEIVHRRIGRRRPVHPPAAGRAARNQQPVATQRQQHLPPGAQLGEAAEHRRDRLQHGLVRAEHHCAALVVVEADRQPLAQLTAGGLVPQTSGQPGADQVQLGLAHRAFQAKHEAVVEVTRVIDAVRVGDQRVGQRAQIQQLVPVGVVAGQPADLDAEDDADPAQADVGDQILESFPRGRFRTGTAQVGVDHPHLMRVPAQRDRTFAQLVLPQQAFGVLSQLGQRRLADIHIGVSAQMHRADLARHQHSGRVTHRRRRVHPWRRLSRSAHCGRSAEPAG